MKHCLEDLFLFNLILKPVLIYWFAFFSKKKNSKFIFIFIWKASLQRWERENYFPSAGHSINTPQQLGSRPMPETRNSIQVLCWWREPKYLRHHCQGVPQKEARIEREWSQDSNLGTDLRCKTPCSLSTEPKAHLLYPFFPLYVVMNLSIKWWLNPI